MSGGTAGTKQPLKEGGKKEGGKKTAKHIDRA